LGIAQPVPFLQSPIRVLRWFATAGDVKLLQSLMMHGQGWARGYAAAAVVECIVVLNDGKGSVSSSGTKDAAAILSNFFEVLVDEKVFKVSGLAEFNIYQLQFPFLSNIFFSSFPFQISRSIGDERDCCACINYILHSVAPILVPSILDVHITSLRSVVSHGRDVQAVVALQQLALLIQLGRIPRSSCDWFIDAIAASAAGPSTPALRMASATALRACVITYQLLPVPLLSRFLAFTLVPEPSLSDVRNFVCSLSILYLFACVCL
jgi:hypothetical protein